MSLLVLAPMEGLLDYPLREVLTAVGGVDRCVSEFIRITDRLLPDRVFTRIVPELLHGGRTRAGVPVRPQLLGSDPACMAENAAQLATLGPDGIDLNFGCPAKVVNRHGGGASLLREPELLHRVVAAVRRAVPAHLPVTAKMRLGYDDDALADDCARAIATAGADELVVHARTKAQGYRPPAHWERIPSLLAIVDVPVIANGEIWTVDDARRCRAESGCEALMLGRGMVADPGLARAIRRADGGAARDVATAGEAPPEVPWRDVLPHVALYLALVSQRVEPRHRAGRIKQWLHYLRRRYAEAAQAYDEVRTINDPMLLAARLFTEAARSARGAVEASVRAGVTSADDSAAGADDVASV
jgi:tRNA-dihydrouridine synthase C